MSGFALPKRLVFRKNICDYCDSESHYEEYTVECLHGIITCREHKDLAIRDVNAWLHLQGFVRMKDVLNAFILPSESIVVPRSDGSFTPGKLLSLEFCFAKMIDGVWGLPVLFSIGGLEYSKNIPVEDLELSGVSQEIIVALLSRFAEGFYKEEFMLSNAAAEKYSPKSTFNPDIKTIYVEGYGSARMFSP